MPSSEWPTPEAIEATAATLYGIQRFGDSYADLVDGQPKAALFFAAEDAECRSSWLFKARAALTAAAKASPVIPAPKNHTREWTLRTCPVCGFVKVNDDSYTVCEGPSCGPFPSDASHKPAVTDAVVVAEVEPLIWARECAKSSADGWRAAFDYLALHLDADDPDTATVLDEAEARRSCHGTGVAEVIPAPMWTCGTCGAISDRQSCNACGSECMPCAEVIPVAVLKDPPDALILAFVRSTFDKHTTRPSKLQETQARKDLAAVAAFFTAEHTRKEPRS